MFLNRDVLNQLFLPADDWRQLLEFFLNVAKNPESQLPEILTTVGSNQETAAQVPILTDDDNLSSLCDAPSLPGGQPKVRFFPSQGDGESSKEASHFELYGGNPVDSESGTDGGDESSFGAH